MRLYQFLGLLFAITIVGAIKNPPLTADGEVNEKLIRLCKMCMGICMGEGEDYTACRGRCFPGCPDIPYEVLTEVPKRPDPDPTPPEPPSPKPPSRAKRPIQRPKVVAIGRKKEQEEALPEVGRTASAFKPPQAQLPKLQLPAFKLPDLWWLPGILGPRMRDFAGMAPGAGGYGGQGVF